jgi:hypothetical protein
VADPHLTSALDAVYGDWRAFFVRHHPIAAALQGDAAGLGRLNPGFADAEWHAAVERPTLDALNARLDALAPALAGADEVERTLHALLTARVAAGRLDPALTLRDIRPDLALDWASEALHLVLGFPGLRAETRRARLQTWVAEVCAMAAALASRFERASLPAVFRQLGLDALRDLRHLFDGHGAPLLGETPVGLRRALRGLADTLRRAEATPEGFRVGEAPLRGFLQHVESLPITPERLLADGTTWLAEDLDALRAAAATLSPRRPIARIMADLAADHGAPEHLLRDTRACVAELRRWTAEAGLVTLPEAPDCRVAPAPAYLRALAAACLDVPGPWQRRRTRATFYLAAPLPDDTPAEREAAVLDFHRSRLAWVAAHETYPGHLVEHLHRPRAAHEAFQVADSEVFIEGWAHYAEGLLVSHGFRGADPAIAFGVAWARVLRTTRLVAALRLHIEALSIEGATTLFRETTCLDAAGARQEALRAVFEPTVLTYALGRRLIESRRAAAERESGFSLRRFHDALLGAGTLSLGLRA